MNIIKVSAVLVGLSVMGLVGGARAECVLDYPEVTVAYGLSGAQYEAEFAAAEERADLHDAHELNVWRAEALCDQAVQSWLEDDQIPMSAIEGHDGMWEACMRLATPVTVLLASQHYDTTDGAFWRGER